MRKAPVPKLSIPPGPRNNPPVKGGVTTVLVSVTDVYHNPVGAVYSAAATGCAGFFAALRGADFLRALFFAEASGSKRPLFTHSRTLNQVVSNFLAASPNVIPPRTALTTRRRYSSVYAGIARFCFFRIRFRTGFPSPSLWRAAADS